MFWLVIILMAVGTYYVMKWGKKKAEQQGREAAEREAQARPSQPPAQLPATPLPPPPPAAPFDLTKGHVTAQLAGQIGRWSESDATNALGVPTKSRPPRPDGGHQDDYAYVDSAGLTHKLVLTFNGGRLSGIAAYPQGPRLSFEEVKQALGEPILHPEMDELEKDMDPKGYDYRNMFVWVDKTGSVTFFTINHASAAASFLSGASWTTRLP